MNRKQFAYSSLTALMFSLSQVAAAQATDGKGSPSASGLDEIVVTAQKRVENVQDVPKQVEVISPARLQQAAVYSILDLSRVSPSIQGTGAANAPPAIRGISSFAFSIGVQGQTGIVLDDVPQPTFSNLANQLADVQQIEVLPGPQSTLSGRNAAGGLINIVTRSPSATFEGTLLAERTNDRQTRVNGYISGPITDTLGFVVSGYLDNWSGPYYNLQLRHHTGGADQHGIRAKLRWEITPALTATLSGFYTHTETRTAPIITGGPYVVATPGAGSVFAPGVSFATLYPGEVVSRYNRDISAATEGFGKTRVAGGSFRLDYDSAVGTVSSITSYQDARQPRTDEMLGFGFFPFPTQAFTDTIVHYTTQEVRLASKGTGPWQYLLGGIYSDTSNFEPFRRPILFPVDWDRRANVGSFALYGRSTYTLPSNTAITAGLRYQADKYKYDFVFSDGTAPRSRDSSKYDFLSGEVSLSQELATDVKAYLTYANAQTGRAYDLEDNGSAAVGVLKPLDSEKVQSYELGFKSRFADRRVTLNVSIFQADYSNYQIQSLIPPANATSLPVIRLLGIGKVRNRGAEVQLDFAATQNLRFGVTASYLDAVIRSYPGAQCYTRQTAAQGCVAGVQSLDGATLPGTSKFKGTFSANYVLPLESLPFDATFGLFARYQTKSHFDLLNDPVSRQAGYGIVNLTVGLRDRDNRYSAELFVNNVTNQHYYAGLTNAVLSPSFALNASYARDSFRFGGIRLTGRF